MNALKRVLSWFLRERTVIGGVVTAVAIELNADLNNPDFHWRDLIPVGVGLVGRWFTSPYSPFKKKAV